MFFPRMVFPKDHTKNFPNVDLFRFIILLKLNEYSKSCKKFYLILVVEEMMYFVLAPFSRRLLFCDQTFILSRRFWVFWIVCRNCQIFIRTFWSSWQLEVLEWHRDFGSFSYVYSENVEMIQLNCWSYGEKIFKVYKVFPCVAMV